MFCITGEWDRALTQLKVAGELDPKAEAMVTTYQAAIRCEILREKVFRGERTPTVFGDPGDWVPLLIEANRLLATGQRTDAARLRDAGVRSRAPSRKRCVNGNAFHWVGRRRPAARPDRRSGGRRALHVDPATPHQMAERGGARPTCATRSGCRPASPGPTTARPSHSFPTRYPGSAASADPLDPARPQDRVAATSTTTGRCRSAQRMLVTDAGRDRADGPAHASRSLHATRLMRRRQPAPLRPCPASRAASGCSRRCSTA